MEYLNHNKFANQTNLGWTFSFEANGKYPMIANRIFATKDGAELFITSPTAIPGLILRVIEDPITSKNGAYFVEKDGENSLKLTKIFTGIPDISGKMVTVVVATDNKFYDINDCTYDEQTQTYTPKSGAVAIVNSSVTEAGKYLFLKLGDDKIYINSKDLISLDDYYTKEQINAYLNTINASVNNVENFINSSIGDFDYTQSSTIKEYIDDLYSSLNSSLYNVSTAVDGILDIIGEGVVTSVVSNTQYISVDPSINDAIINASIAESIDSSNFANTALITNGYLDEKLAWVEVEESEIE